MKKPKSSSSATPPQPETKPAEAKTTKCARDVAKKTPQPPEETKPAEINPPSKQNQPQPPRRFPTRFELTQIAATLIGKKNLHYFEPEHLFHTDKVSVSDAALGLWQQCAQTLREAERFDAEMDEMLDQCGDGPDIPDWVSALEHETFPLAFDRSLEIIMGSKKRRDERHKAFRHFLHAYYRRAIKDVPQAEAEADKRFAELKATGFIQKTFEKTGQLFPLWKSEQAKEKARKAAEKRWAKKNQKKTLGGF
jgi:hypothetical protein